MPFPNGSAQQLFWSWATDMPEASGWTIRSGLICENAANLGHSRGKPASPQACAASAHAPPCLTAILKCPQNRSKTVRQKELNRPRRNGLLPAGWFFHRSRQPQACKMPKAEPPAVIDKQGARWECSCACLVGLAGQPLTVSSAAAGRTVAPHLSIPIASAQRCPVKRLHKGAQRCFRRRAECADRPSPGARIPRISRSLDAAQASHSFLARVGVHLAKTKVAHRQAGAQREAARCVVQRT
jgi:hypothetical protein